MSVPSLYFLSLVMMVKRNPERFALNREFYTTEMDIVTRGRNELRVPAHSSSFYEHSPSYMAIRAYRSLPDAIRQLESTKSFRKCVIRYAKDNCFYTFNR